MLLAGCRERYPKHSLRSWGVLVCLNSFYVFLRFSRAGSLVQFGGGWVCILASCCLGEENCICLDALVNWPTCGLVGARWHAQNVANVLGTARDDLCQKRLK